MKSLSVKKLGKICIICVAVVWLFCIGIMAGTYLVRSGIMTEPSDTEAYVNNQTTESTTQILIDMVTNQAKPTTTEKVTVELPSGDTGLTTYANSQGSNNAQTNSQTQATEPESKIPSTKKEMINALVSAINATKATPDFTAERKHHMTVAIDDITGGELVKGIADSVIADQTDMTDSTFVFVGGRDSGGSDETPGTLIFPPNKQAYLDESAVKNITSKDNGDGTYSIHLEMNPENQTSTSPAVHHDGIYETISVESFGLPSSVNVTSMYATYNASVIDAVINEDGKLKSISYCMPVSDGGGEGKMLGITVSIKMHGQYDGTINFTY